MQQRTTKINVSKIISIKHALEFPTLEFKTAYPNQIDNNNETSMQLCKKKVPYVLS